MLINTYRIITKDQALTALLLMLYFAFPSGVGAVSIENPGDTYKKGFFSVAPEVNISSRGIKYSDKDLTENSLQYLVKGGYGLLDWINVYGTVGGARSYDDTGFEGHLGLAYGGGAKVRFYRYEDWLILGLTGEYLRFTSSDDNVGGVPGLNQKSTWNQYDLGVGASTKIDVSNFYAGGLLSFVDGDLSGSHFKERQPFGFFLGADAELIEHLRFGFETRLYNETTFTFKLSYIFGGPKPVAEKK